MKIWLVEDEEDLSRIVNRGLHKSGYAVDQAYDGEEALDYYRVNAYDVIVLDLNLPKLDGLEVLQYIRQKDKKTKILILSARCDGLRLNMSTKMVFFQENSLTLTRKEFAILEYMMLQKGQVISAVGGIKLRREKNENRK